jgi:hyperosmotically inducible protein
LFASLASMPMISILGTAADRPESADIVLSKRLPDPEHTGRSGYSIITGEYEVKNRILVVLAGALLSMATTAVADKSAGQVIDDNTVNASVKAALIGNKTTKAHDINVETYKGVVQLSGFVETLAEKEEAGKVAAGVEGVKSVSNNIAIGAKTAMGAKLDDSVTTGRVKAALIDTKDVKSGQINVETKAGVVQLSGFVNSAAMKDKAGSVAAGVSGVKEVQNVLVVKPD